MNQEPQGVEVFRTVATLGLDVQPAVKSAEELAAALKKTDTALQHLTRTAKTASMAGASAITMPAALEGSIAGWRMLESASTAGLAGGGGGGLLGFLTKAGGGFNWPLAIGTFALSTILSGIQKKLSQPLAPQPQDQYVYKISSPEFNPFSSPERAYYAGTGRENVEVRAINLNFAPGSINVKDGTDVGRKIAEGIENYWGRIRTINRSGSWSMQR